MPESKARRRSHRVGAFGEIGNDQGGGAHVGHLISQAGREKGGYHARHVAADGAEVGVAMGSRGRRALAHDDDAVGQREHLVESALISSTAAPRLRASMMRDRISATAAKSRPKQGCWRPAAPPRRAARVPARRAGRCRRQAGDGRVGPGARMPYSAISARAFLRNARPLTSARPSAKGLRSNRRKPMFSATDMAPTQALRSGSSGRQRTRWRACRRGSRGSGCR